ncbi:hypothetical protein MJT46_017375 [Ovis ammon polii x Ovis aries]|nr:hypothetical protein MJT46_017375 [Ovis ammon polii x Ovis aries]
MSRQYCRASGVVLPLTFTPKGVWIFIELFMHILCRFGEKSHADCVLIYKSETEGDRDHTPDTDFLGFPTKMLTVKRLGGSNACYRSDQLEKMAFFQCMEEVEKCFLEESSGEQDSRSGKNQKTPVQSKPPLDPREQEHRDAENVTHKHSCVISKHSLQDPLGEGSAVCWASTPRRVPPASLVAADALAPPAPFDHRIVTARQAAVNSFYTVSRTEILGGGRFGQVHKCEEKATGLKLAAKIIKTRGVKDKDDVKNEISVMNQLDHVNLIQLYDAFESKNDIVLVMEYVGGGELFDRIIDDNCSLTELDTILFIRQICEGIRHMHQMYILHLDLKPENILCVNRDTKQIKIIDFGLARRYKPRERLKVNFGTPEFLAPEVVNYDFVSFPTDMWSVGVITYMLLSGLSPFLGDDDAETLNNILACRWDLEDQEFQDISEEAREFISKLLIKEKSWRISASEALKHPWLADHKLHSRLSTQKSLASSTSARRPCAVAEPEGETGKTCGKTQLMPSITVITAFAIENRILEKKIDDFSVLIVINPRLRRIEHTQSSLIYERKLKYLRCFPFVCELLFQRNVEGLLSPTCSAKISASAWQRLLCGSSLPGLCVSQRQPASRKQTNNLISVIHKCVNTSAWKPICQRLNYDAEVLVKAVERCVLRWVASALNLAIPPVST